MSPRGPGGGRRGPAPAGPPGRAPGGRPRSSRRAFAESSAGRLSEEEIAVEAEEVVLRGVEGTVPLEPLLDLAGCQAVAIGHELRDQLTHAKTVCRVVVIAVDDRDRVYAQRPQSGLPKAAGD